MKTEVETDMTMDLDKNVTDKQSKDPHVKMCAPAKKYDKKLLAQWKSLKETSSLSEILVAKWTRTEATMGLSTTNRFRFYDTEVESADYVLCYCAAIFRQRLQHLNGRAISPSRFYHVPSQVNYQAHLEPEY